MRRENNKSENKTSDSLDFEFSATSDKKIVYSSKSSAEDLFESYDRAKEELRKLLNENDQKYEELGGEDNLIPFEPLVMNLIENLMVKTEFNTVLLMEIETKITMLMQKIIR